MSSRNGQLWGRTQTTQPEVRGKLEAVQRTLLCLHRTRQAEAARRPAHAPPSASQVPPRPAPALHLGPLLRVPPVRLALQPPKPRCRPRRPPPRDSRALRRPPSPEVASVRDRRQNSSAERWDRAKKKGSGGCGQRLREKGVGEGWCPRALPCLQVIGSGRTKLGESSREKTARESPRTGTSNHASGWGKAPREKETACSLGGRGVWCG